MNPADTETFTGFFLDALLGAGMVFFVCCVGFGVLLGDVDVHQQSRMAVASDSLVHRRESIFGAEVNMSPSLHQHPDGLASTGFTLHGKGQGSLCQENKHTTFTH